MSSASKAELGALFITAQEMVAMRQTLEEIKWPHPKSPIQTNNSAAAGVVNITIGPPPPQYQMQRSSGSILLLLGKREVKLR